MAPRKNANFSNDTVFKDRYNRCWAGKVGKGDCRAEFSLLIADVFFSFSIVS